MAWTIERRPASSCGLFPAAMLSSVEFPPSCPSICTSRAALHALCNCSRGCCHCWRPDEKRSRTGAAIRMAALAPQGCAGQKPGRDGKAQSSPVMSSVPSPATFSFRLLATDGDARRGEMTTAHGPVATPVFMPVGTQATVKGLAPGAVRATGTEIVLANTYHLMLRPGAERIAALGGLHRFMNWPHPIFLTNSGGFQVMSLSQLRKVADGCVTFRSHIDGAMVELSSERAIGIQNLLGSDIAMQLDECLRLPAPRRELERAMRLSLASSSVNAGGPLKARHGAGPCSASCRAVTTRNCAWKSCACSDRYRLPRLCSSAGLRWANRRRSCCARSPRSCLCFRSTVHTTSWAWERPDPRTTSRPSRVRSTPTTIRARCRW